MQVLDRRLPPHPFGFHRINNDRFDLHRRISDHVVFRDRLHSPTSRNQEVFSVPSMRDQYRLELTFILNRRHQPVNRVDLFVCVLLCRGKRSYIRLLRYRDLFGIEEQEHAHVLNLFIDRRSFVRHFVLFHTHLFISLFCLLVKLIRGCSSAHLRHRHSLEQNRCWTPRRFASNGSLQFSHNPLTRSSRTLTFDPIWPL